MKYLIFSDTHLTPQFEPAKFAVLKNAIEQSDRVIINGDFWEGITSSFDQFVNSEWNRTLFPLLKKRKAVYLFGNHDKESFSDKRRLLFSDVQRYEYQFKSGKRTFFVTHGDRLIVLPDISSSVRHILETIENIVFHIFGKLFIRIAYKGLNDRLKKKIEGKYKEDEFLITGHTHFAEIDLEKHYINGGFNNYGLSQYLLVEDGKVTAVEKRY